MRAPGDEPRKRASHPYPRAPGNGEALGAAGNFHQRQSLTRLHAEAPERQAYVFVNSKGPAAGDRVGRQNVWRDFQAFRRRSGVPKCTLHDLRKSSGTNLARSVPLHVVQELAGHVDIRTTRKHYSQVRAELIDAARRAVDEVLSNVRVSN
jgi:integrase